MTQSTAPSRIAILSYVWTVWPLTLAQLSLALIPPFYVGAYGLPLAFVGLVLTIGRIVDVFGDIAVAWGSDRTRTRWGRRKPWIVVGLLLYAPATWLLFVPTGPMSTTRYAITMMAFFLSWTIAFIPYLSQGTEISDDYKVKNRINLIQSAVMLLCLVVGILGPFLLIDPRAAAVRAAAAHLLAAVLPAGAEAYLLRPSPSGTAYFAQSMLLTTIIALAPLIVVLPLYMATVKEKARHLAKLGAFTAAFRNPVFVRFALGYVLLMAGTNGQNALMPFILTNLLRQPDSYLFYMMIQFATSLVVTPIWARFLGRFERNTCIAMAGVLFAAGLGLLFLIPPGSAPLTIAGFVALGLAGQTMIMVPYLVAADAADYSLWKTGADSRGVHISLISIILKCGAVFGAAALWLVATLGFNPQLVVQTPRSIFVLKLVGLGLPVLFLIVGAAIVTTFPLTRRKHDAIARRIGLRARATAV